MFKNDNDTKYEITFNVICTPEERENISFLLMDALANFKSLRVPAEAYVRKGYTWKTEEEIKEKIKEVEMRNTLSFKLHSSVFCLHITEVE